MPSAEQQRLRSAEGAGRADHAHRGAEEALVHWELGPTSSSSGTYTTSDGILTQTESSGTPDDNAYCVKGNKLTLSPANPDSAVSGSIVLTKQ